MKFDRPLVQVLSPYGEWPHRLGMQIVDEKSLESMRSAARFSALVGCGIPVYVGHPDESPRSKARPVGKISRIFSLGDGIGVEAKYTEEAFEKISSGRLKSMSPRWRMEKLPDDRFRPVKLISAGLTNNPNIPESGRVVGALPRGLDSAKARAEKSGKLSAAAKGAAERAKKCSEAAGRLRELSRAAVVEARMRLSRPPAKPGGGEGPAPAQKGISPREMAELAARRSERLGEPYSRSFAAIRKQCAFHNPQTKGTK